MYRPVNVLGKFGEKWNADRHTVYIRGESYCGHWTAVITAVRIPWIDIQKRYWMDIYLSEMKM